MLARPYQIQHTPGPLPFEQPRVNYPDMFATLRFPLLWSLDRWLGAYLPGELTCDVGAADIDEMRAAGLVDPVGRQSWQALRGAYQRDGFVRIPQLFDAVYARSFLQPYFWRMKNRHGDGHELDGVKRKKSHNLPLMRHLHQATEALIAYVVGEPIRASYAFSSAYEPGSCLPPHTDRPQCVFNVSAILGSDPALIDLTSWPLWIRRNGDHRIALGHGDAVLYSGVKDLHWRTVMPAELKSVNGIFFHYVNADFVGDLN